MVFYTSVAIHEQYFEIFGFPSSKIWNLFQFIILQIMLLLPSKIYWPKGKKIKKKNLTKQSFYLKEKYFTTFLSLSENRKCIFVEARSFILSI